MLGLLGWGIRPLKGFQLHIDSLKNTNTGHLKQVSKLKMK
jgi:hypothetical protein